MSISTIFTPLLYLFNPLPQRLFERALSNLRSECVLVHGPRQSHNYYPPFRKFIGWTPRSASTLMEVSLTMPKMGLYNVIKTTSTCCIVRNKKTHTHKKSPMTLSTFFHFHFFFFKIDRYQNMSFDRRWVFFYLISYFSRNF